MKNKEITIYELIGLIKDDKAPKSIMFDNEIYTLEEDSYCSILEEKYLFKVLNERFSDIEIPFLIVEILPEENDEWEDIEEYQYSIIPSYFALQNAIKTINRNFETHQKALESIIKNQKYLKEKLEEK